MTNQYQHFSDSYISFLQCIGKDDFPKWKTQQCAGCNRNPKHCNFAHGFFDTQKWYYMIFMCDYKKQICTKVVEHPLDHRLSYKKKDANHSFILKLPSNISQCLNCDIIFKISKSRLYCSKCR